jgi:hypothetical protein
MNHSGIGRVFGIACLGAGLGVVLSMNNNKKLFLSNDETEKAEGKYILARNVFSGAIIGTSIECCPELILIFVVITGLECLHHMRSL